MAGRARHLSMEETEAGEPKVECLPQLNLELEGHPGLPPNKQLIIMGADSYSVTFYTQRWLAHKFSILSLKITFKSFDCSISLYIIDLIFLIFPPSPASNSPPVIFMCWGGGIMSPSPSYAEMLPVPILLRVCVGNSNSERVNSLAMSCPEDTAECSQTDFYHLSAPFPPCTLSINRRMPLYKMDVPWS